MSEQDEFLPDFLSEAAELIEQARSALKTLNTGADREEVLNSVFRAVHTVKGGAGMFQFENTKNLAHKLETLLTLWRKAPAKFSEVEAAKIVRALDHLETLLQTSDKQQGKNPVESVLAPMASPAPTTVSETIAIPEPTAPSETAAGEFASLAQELAGVAAEPVLEKSKAETPASSPPAMNGPTLNSTPSDMLRVPVSRVQRNLDVISEVFLIRNQMIYLVEKFFSASSEENGFLQAWEILDNSLRRSIGELESVAMSMRMMPFNGLFGRMEKTVRAYVTDSGKEIHVEKTGEDTELDKKVLDALSEPLIHLIRNAMDHGIESPEIRKAAGKAPAGTVSLHAKVAGNEVVLTVEDDGKGMEAEKIKSAAIAKGIDVSGVIDDKSALELIFLPGFSTVSKVTETSGRGVGMDVVKSAVERLGGNISIETQPGKGTSFHIRLPLSMSVIPAIVVRLDDALYAVSTADIIETQRVPTKQIKMNASDSFLPYRGNFIPLYDLESLLQGKEARTERYQSFVFVCVIRHRESYLALRVGALENNTEVMVKPVPALAPQVSYVTGISVLPTGRPVFVLSLGRLCRERLTGGEVTHEAA
ncbi:MAG: chemotaxis protein CheA [Bdellovibrionota bacterium]